MSGTDKWALPYQRLPLEQSRKEVRLIEFHFEGGGDGFLTKAIDMDEEAKMPISLRMVKASLLEPPKFRALSYVWGPSTQGRRITLQVPQKADLKGKSTENVSAAGEFEEQETLESCEVEVTDNLFSALVHYRTMSSADKPAYLWVDALCINQRDNGEKSWQVAMMRDVYKSARMVMAWLGPYPEDPVRFRPGELVKTFAALSRDGLARFGREVCQPLSVVRTAESLGFAEEDVVGWVRGIEIDPGPFSRASGDGTYLVSEPALFGFMSLAFWWRVWILQEVMLANEILFTWATWSIPSGNLFVALRVIAKAMQVAGGRGPLSSTQGIGDVLPPDRPWARTSNEQELTMSPMLDRRHDEERSNELWDLIHWNAFAGGLRATMPADHVFGLFGVATDVEELGIRLDYNRQVADIYTELATACVKKKGLVVLTDVQWPKKVAGLPSWVPDWSALSITNMRDGIWSSHGPSLNKFIHVLCEQGAESYAGPREYKFTASSAGLPALVVGGNAITTVQSFLPDMRNAHDANPRLMRRIWNIQAKLLAVQDTIEQSATAYRTVQDRHTAFASTIVAGGWERGRRKFEDQWSLGKLVEGYRLLLGPESAETSLSALWRRESPFRQMVFHAINACFELAEDFIDADPSTFPLPAIDGVPIAKICRHPGLYYRIAFDDYADQVLGSLADIEGAEHTMANIAVFLDRMEEVGQGRRLFLCADGYLGLGPAEMQEHDVVAHLDGAEVPFVLRPLPAGDFTLVGEAYVYGLMDRDTKLGDITLDIFPFVGPSPELETTIHQCPEGERREFVIV